MTVRNIAISVARLLQADDIEELLNVPDVGDDGESDEIAAATAAENDEDVKLLVACINAAVNDIAADGFPICVNETLAASCCVVPISAFSRSPSTVRRVADRAGVVTFGFDSNGVAVPHDGAYEIMYTVEPDEAGLDDELELGAMCDRSMLTYMSARNYCLVTGRTDEASVWDQMYEAHTARKRLTRRARLPERVWR
ncbi:MAG: hypothetical protein K2M48_05065 [Clostridiales bacterium]|nr:hypothetical protein [Clostridiales bacterium]